MVYSRFGYRLLKKDTRVDHLLRSVENIDSYSAQLLLREAYETCYSIYNHDHSDAHPLALVMAHPKEDVSEYSAAYRAVYNYRTKDVYKYFGLSLTDFLAMPREYTNLCLRIIDEEAARDSRRLSETEEQMRKAQEGKRGK